MLTKVYLEGVMGDQFGHEWELEIASPAEAIRLIDANSPGLLNWIRGNVRKYSHYQVVVEYQDGATEPLNDGTYLKDRVMASVRFVPVIAGSGKWTNAIVGAILIVVGYYVGGQQGAGMMKMGASMMIGGVIQALTTRTSNARLSSDSARESKSLVSEGFDGPVNTVQQGTPIPLIYGRVMVGSQVISAGLVVDQLM